MPQKENGSQNEKLVTIVCPTCKAEKKLTISRSILSTSRNLTTISIQKNEICEHHFQAFIDNDFKVRGYQKVDFEIATAKRLPKGDFFMKVILIGDYQVGKTAIIRRFIDNTFDEFYLPTLQLDISKKKLNFGETSVTLIIWDVGGQSFTMSTYRDKFYDGAQSAIIVVDRTRQNTLENVDRWYKDTQRAIQHRIPYILVGNKSDLNGEVVVHKQDLEDEAKKFHFNYILTSAKTGENINELFINLTHAFLESQFS